MEKIHRAQDKDRVNTIQENPTNITDESSTATTEAPPKAA